LNGRQINWRANFYERAIYVCFKGWESLVWTNWSEDMLKGEMRGERADGWMDDVQGSPFTQMPSLT
jgi:hypothetical protein